jgi:hypothetical protein
MDDFLSKLVFVIPAVTGGLAGALFTLYFSRRREKSKLALDFIKEYNQMFFDLSYVYYLLENPDRYKSKSVSQQTDNNSCGNEKGSREDNKNRIKNFGNWYNMLAALYLDKQVNRKIIHAADLDKSILNFKDKISSAPEFENWEHDFPFIYKLSIESKLGIFRHRP